jgi:putative FmdB family regulatory protein
MPIYEYECPACGAVFSELMPIDATTTPQCPRCGNAAARKRLSRFAMGQTEDQRQAVLEEHAAAVDHDDRRDIARFFKKTGGGGWMDDEAFREVVDRAAAGATDEDMADIIAEIPVFGRAEALAKYPPAHQAAGPAPSASKPQQTDDGEHVHGPDRDHDH